MTKPDIDLLSEPVNLRLELFTGPMLEFVTSIDVKLTRPPGAVMRHDNSLFVYAYQENPTTFCYRETTCMQITKDGALAND